MSAPLFAVVLGVAQDAGHPQAGCRKACCRDAWNDPSLRHHAACLAIVDPVSNQRWLLDASPDLPQQLAMLSRISPGSLSGILLTHAHIGHYTGLMHLGREAMDAKVIPVWAMPRMTQFLSENEPWSSIIRQGHVQMRPLSAGEAVRLNERVQITPLLVPHRDELSETVGFLVEGPERKLLFLPDIDKWERWKTSIESVIARVDVALVDGTFFANGEIEGRDMSQIPHPFIEESIARFSSMPAAHRDRVRFIHLNHTNPALFPDSEAAKVIRAAGLHVAQEGEQHPL